MTSQKRGNVVDLSSRGEALLESTRKMLQDADSDGLRALVARVPARLTPDDAPIRMVFAGQYSAGKSSILRVLTGRKDIATGAGITTQKAHVYEWDGIRVVDTPGIHTKLRPDHDEISYREIAAADLLVFVVTNELFDDHLGKHFRQLAIERDKAHEILLVVNKMNRDGNSKRNQDVKRDDLRKVLAPFTPEQLRTSFVAAEDAEAAITASPERAELLRKRSGFEEFEKSLETFIRERGLLGKWSTAAYELEQVLQEALATQTSGDDDADGLEELLLQKRRALLDAQRRIPESAETAISRVASEAKAQGRSAAEMIHGSAKPDEVNAKIRTAQRYVEQATAELSATLEGVISQELKDLDEKFSAIAESELARELLPRLANRMKAAMENANVDPDVLRRLRGAAGASTNLGKFLVQNSFNPTATTLGGLFKLNQYSGTAVHGVVKGVAGVFGKSFKPWEAVKLTRTIANAGRVLAVAGTVISIGLQIWEDIQEAERERDLRESRSAVRASFNETAHDIEMHFDAATRQYVNEAIDPEIAAVDKQLADLRALQQRKGALYNGLSGLLVDVQAFIRDIHSKAA